MSAQQKALEKAFKLLDKYNKLMDGEGNEQQLDSIVAQLYRAGYIIRPANVLIIKNDFGPVESEHLNPGSREWTLHSRATNRPVVRPASSEEAD